MKLKMFKDNVLLKLAEEDVVTDTGLVQAHTKGERTEAWALMAEVIEKGPEVNKSVKSGDIVYVGKWEIQHATINGKKLAIAKDKDLLLAIE